MRRWSIASGLLVALVSLAPAPSAGALPVAPTVPPQACSLLGTVPQTAAGLQTTAESSTGQNLPLELSAVLEDAVANAGCGTDPGPGGTPSQLCVLLSVASALATTLEQTVERETGTGLPVSPEGTARDISREAGCAPSASYPTGVDPVCTVLETVRGTARTIQALAESTAGQKLPVELSTVVGEIAVASGCGDTGEGGPTAAACDLVATVAEAGDTVQTTVESASGQGLPVVLSATIEDVANEGGCVKAASGASDESAGSSSSSEATTTTSTVTPSGGSDGSGRTAAAALGTSAPGDLPRTGPMVPARTPAGGFALASLIALTLSRRLGPRRA